MATQNKYKRVDIQRKNGRIDVDAPLHKVPDEAMPKKPRTVPKQAARPKPTKKKSNGFFNRFITATLAVGAMYSITPAMQMAENVYHALPASEQVVQRAKLYPDASDGMYILMASSSPANANIHLQTLDKLGFPVATELTVKDGKTLKRVMINYDSTEQLDDIVERLEQYGHTEKPLILKKRDGADADWRQYVKPISCDTLTLGCIEKAPSISSLPFYEEVKAAAKELAADPLLRAKGLDEHMAKKILYTQIVIESNGRPGVVSNKGAVGLGQVLPTTALHANGYDAPKRGTTAYHNLIENVREKLLDPAYNIDTTKNVSRDYLRIALDHTGADNIEDALDAYRAAYNAGPTNMKTGKHRKFKETRKYIVKGQQVYSALTDRFG
jgi:hypothetical protein